MVNEYKLSQFGKELVEAMPDRKKMAAVRRKWARLAALKEKP